MFARTVSYTKGIDEKTMIECCESISKKLGNFKALEQFNADQLSDLLLSISKLYRFILYRNYDFDWNDFIKIIEPYLYFV